MYWLLPFNILDIRCKDELLHCYKDCSHKMARFEFNFSVPTLWIILFWSKSLGFNWAPNEALKLKKRRRGGARIRRLWKKERKWIVRYFEKTILDYHSSFLCVVITVTQNPFLACCMLVVGGGVLQPGKCAHTWPKHCRYTLGNLCPPPISKKMVVFYPATRLFPLTCIKLKM